MCHASQMLWNNLVSYLLQFFLAISPDFQNQNEGATFSTTKIDVKSASSAEFVSSFLLLEIWKNSSRNKFSD